MRPAETIAPRTWSFHGEHTGDGWDLDFHVTADSSGVHWKCEKIAPHDYNVLSLASQTHEEFCQMGGRVPLPPAIEQEIRAYLQGEERNPSV